MTMVPCNLFKLFPIYVVLVLCMTYCMLLNLFKYDKVFSMSTMAL